MALSSSERLALAPAADDLLAAGQKQTEGIAMAMLPLRDAVMRKPVDIRNYTILRIPLSRDKRWPPVPSG